MIVCMNRGREIDPDEVLLDSSNIPKYDQSQFEGRLEKPISKTALVGIGVVFLVIIAIFLVRAVNLQIINGAEYLKQSQNNLLHPVPIFASRGVIIDRNGVILAWNAPSDDQSESAVPRREYLKLPGLAHVLGYVSYPSKDKNGFYYRNDFEGVDGVEKYFNVKLTGRNGSRLIETDARGQIISQNVVRLAERGESIMLSVDSRVQSALYENIKKIASEFNFKGGAGVIMDVRTGEVLAITSYPEYNPQLMSDGVEKSKILAELNNPNLLFLDRAVGGLYTPGSIIKPYVAIGALNENIIDATTVIRTTGSIEVQNVYNPDIVNIFRDWKNHGPVDMRRAIAVSSDAYFYIIGGGYKDQKGMGISNIDKYLRLFGLGEIIPSSFFTGPAGILSSPAWKQSVFKESWYLGDTYNSVIGQYGTQVTPMQIVRAVGVLATNGKLFVPTIMKDDMPNIERVIDLPQKYFDVVHEGMRLSVKQGTSVALNKNYVEIAGKSGTAELGALKASVNSWITGFWPNTDPHYAFAVILEHGSVHNLIGAAAVMSNHLDWMNKNTPEYFK